MTLQRLRAEPDDSGCQIRQHVLSFLFLVVRITSDGPQTLYFGGTVIRGSSRILLPVIHPMKLFQESVLVHVA